MVVLGRVLSISNRMSPTVRSIVSILSSIQISIAVESYMIRIETSKWELMMTEVWPSEIRVSKDKKLLNVSFDDGAAYSLSAEMLRVLSPSAEVQGHGPGQKVTVPRKRNVEISDIVAAGHYAIRITFSDGHDSGIFTWKYLRELGQTGETAFADYLKDLAEKGLSRD